MFIKHINNRTNYKIIFPGFQNKSEYPSEGNLIIFKEALGHC